MKKVAFSFICLLCCSILLSQPAFAILPNDDIIDMLENTGSYYYNPSGASDYCNSSSTTLQGNDITEKVWNYYISKGFTDAQVAGILGNIRAETDVQPTRASGPVYWGFFQMKDERKAGLFQKIAEADLSKYTSSEYWPNGAWKNIPANDLDRLIEVELEYAYNEKSRNWKEEIKKQNTPEAAAEVFLTLFERAVNGKDEILYYAPFKGLKYQGAVRRRNYAKEYYDKYAGHGTVVSGAASTAENGKNISIIGDKAIAQATAAILKQFPDLTEDKINTAENRTWEEGVELLKDPNLSNYVVFALSSSDLTTEKIDEALKAIGDTRKIVFITNENEISNMLLRSYAQLNNRILIADWEATVKEKQSSGITASISTLAEDGQKLFAETIYKAINGNIGSNGCNVNNEFQSLVVSYAWPEYHKAPFTDRMPAYAEAVTRSISEKRYVGGSINGVPGIDCGGFVTIITQNSGLEPNYNDTKGGTDNQEIWVNNHNWILLNGDRNTRIDTSVLQPGDVAFTTGHTFIYVGEIPGFNSVIASASYGAAYARAPMAGHEDLIYNKEPVRWYRNPKLVYGGK